MRAATGRSLAGAVPNATSPPESVLMQSGLEPTMSIGGFRHIPLMKDGRPTRVISIRDLFRHVSTFVHKQPARAT